MRGCGAEEGAGRREQERGQWRRTGPGGGRGRTGREGQGPHTERDATLREQPPSPHGFENGAGGTAAIPARSGAGTL